MSGRYYSLATFSLATLFAGLCLAVQVHAGSVEYFSPQGEQLDIRQAQARFSAPMTALGQSDAAAPFLIECGVSGHGYWVDERNWVYDLAGTPQAGDSCRFKLKPGLTTLAGDKIDAVADFAFSVIGPRILAILPNPGTTLDEDQIFVLRLNGTAQADSVTAHARCEVQGIHEQIPLLRLSGTERSRMLRQLKDQLYELGNDWGERDPAADPSLEVLRCQRTLPANAKLALVWGAGIKTASGQRNPVEQRLQFSVRDHFVVHMRCQRANAKAGCLPLTPIRVEFTAPVAREHLDGITLKDSKGKAYAQKKTQPAAANDTDVRFAGPFPPSTDLTLSLPVGLVDDKGRKPVNAARFPMRFKTDEMPPLVKFSGDFGIIERVAGGLLPITLRNLEPDSDSGSAARIRWLRLTDDAAILDWQNRLQRFDNPPYQQNVKQQPDPRKARMLTAEIPQLNERKLPKPNGAQAFEVVGLALEKPGYYVLEAESQRLGKALLGENRPMYVRSSALVTNLAVHFKWGPASSLAWVTRLDLGTPVAGARIAVRDCRGRLFAEANTDKQGMALLPNNLPDPRSVEYNCPLYVSARKDDDLSFARSDWNEGIETWRFGLPENWDQDARIAHSLLDRTLFRPGDTVHMKHVLRDKHETGLGYPTKLPPTLQIEHGASNQRWFLPLVWRNGAASTDWKVPQGAKRGNYSLRLLDKEIRPDGAPDQLEYLAGLDSGAFSVGDFRVPLMRADIDPVKPDLIAARKAEFDLSVHYLNGGGARNLPVKLRAQLEPHHRVAFAEFKDYRFAVRRDDENGSQESESISLPVAAIKLDANGVGRSNIGALPALSMPHKLRVELEYADPNGEIQTISRTTPWWPANVVLGLKNTRWARAGQTHTLQLQAVDPTGKVAADVPVEVRLSLRQTFTHRVRLTGGFYGYQSETRETAIPANCAGKTDAKGQFTCEAGAEQIGDQGGEILVNARALDSTGRAATTQHSFWVAGRDEWVFDQANHDRIDLIPEKKHYEPGETARFQVRMPYRKATALITVERDGVLDARVVTLSGKSPVLDIPVKASWAPNVFISALVVRGRNDQVKPTALVDLGRPSFKLGIAGIEIGQRAHRLTVEVKTDRNRYQIRDKAKVRIKVRTPEGGPPPAGTSVTLAAVDEGLLELAPNDSWNLLAAMMAERGYSMQTFTAQMQVTGKRHFGKKALPAGGGGGKLPTRELFDTLLFWQASVALDAQGEANVEVPLNDSLSAFRIVAIAASENQFGNADTRIRSSQDLQIISGLSPVVRESDRLQAYFTVRNGSEREMKIEVSATATGQKDLPVRHLTLAAGEAREIVWPITVIDTDSLDWTLNARELGGKAGQHAHDALKLKQAIHAAVPVRVQAASLYRLEQALDLPVAAPAGSLPGSGELRATLSASLADGQNGLRDYMRHYPYTCLEQKISKAVATQDRAAWDELAGMLPTYLAENGLANYFPGGDQGSVALTAYLLAIADQAEWNLPLEAKSRMQRALVNYLAGRIERTRQAWENPVVLRLAALEALARDGKATPALVSTVKPEPNLWPSSALIDWISILHNTPKLAERAILLRTALAALDARFTLTGKRLNFNNEARDNLWWMMTSADTNALRALLALMPEASWKDRLPKLLTGILARQHDGRWNTTTANAWGVLALMRYQQLFEAVPPSGKSYAVLGNNGRVVDWNTFPRGATAFLPLGTQTTNLKLRHEGEGQPYVSVTTLAAVPITQAVQRGYGVERKIIPIDQKTPGKWSRGDVLRIRLNIDARDDMGWVVVEDPIPAGASILSSGSQRGSNLLTQGESHQGNVWPSWQERLFDTYRVYYEYAPRGRFSLEYTVRLNSDGQFQMPPTRVEAMYAPEMYGEAPNGTFEVMP